MLVAAAPARAQLQIGGGREFLLLQKPDTAKSLPPDSNFFGDAAPGRRQNNTAGLQFPPAQDPSYGEILVLRDGLELRGMKLGSTDDVIRWSRLDASVPLLFPRREVRDILSLGIPETMPDSDTSAGDIAPALALSQASAPDAAALPLAVLAGMYCLDLPALASRDMLVFKNGDELRGTALGATLPGTVRWCTPHGQTVEFKTGRIAGIRLGGARPAPSADRMTVAELRSGERLYGTLAGVDEQQVRLQHPQLGNIPLNHKQLWRLFPEGKAVVCDGARTPAGWAWATSESPEPIAAPPATAKGHWTWLDGAYLLQKGAPPDNIPTSNLPGWAHPIPRTLDRFEIRFELQRGVRAYTNCAFTLFGTGGITLCTTITRANLTYVVMNPQDHPGGKWRSVPLNGIQSASGTLAMRYFVDTKAGTCDILINGVKVLRVGQRAEDRLVVTDYYLRLQPYLVCPTMNLSNIWIGPWSGELPQVKRLEAASTALRNGDIVTGLPKGWREGKWTLESDLGPLEVSTEKVLIVDFGGEPEPKRSPGRVRLVDGSLVDVNAFQWDAAWLSAHSATLGDLRLGATEVSELLFDPAPLHPPLLAAPGQIAAQGGPQRRVMPEIPK